jgi:hypothetical protein
MLKTIFTKNNDLEGYLRILLIKSFDQFITTNNKTLFFIFLIT